jgi:hypothetical protein
MVVIRKRMNNKIHLLNLKYIFLIIMEQTITGKKVSNINFSFNLDNINEYNRKVIYERLETCLNIDNTYKCNDVIETLSMMKIRDKRMINEYATDEVILRKIKTSGYMRLTRFFTEKGLKRYLEEGKIISYKTVCSYFKIEEKNLEYDKLLKELNKCIILDKSTLCDKSIILDKSTLCDKSTVKDTIDKKTVKITSDTKFATKKILNWLFDKRKSNKELGTIVSIPTLLKWIKSTNFKSNSIPNKHKVKLIDDLL